MLAVGVRMRSLWFGIVLAAAMAPGAACAAGGWDCQYDDEVPLTADQTRIVAACLARAHHIAPIVAAGPRVMQIFLAASPLAKLAIDLRWSTDGGAVATVKERMNGNPGFSVAFDPAAARDIAQLFESYAAPTPDGKRLRESADDRSMWSAFVCPVSTASLIATNDTGSIAVVSGNDCHDRWVLEVASRIAAMVLRTDAGCDRLTPVERYDVNIDKLAVCVMIRGDHALAATAFNRQTQLIRPTNVVGQALPPTDLASMAEPDVSLTGAGARPAKGPQAVQDAIAQMIALHKGLSQRVDRIVAHRGTVRIEGCYDNSITDTMIPSYSAAHFTQVWRNDADGEPRLATWRIGRFRDKDWC